MIEAIYGWMQDIVFFLVIVTAVLEVLPGTSYQKYIRFFTGLILMLLLLSPFLKLSGSGEVFTELYHGYEYEQYRRELQEQEAYFQDLDLLDFLPEEYALTESGGTAGDAQGLEREGSSREEGGTDPAGIGVDEIKVEEIRIGEEVE